MYDYEYENLYDDEVWLEATRGVSAAAIAAENDPEIELTEEEKAEEEAWLKGELDEEPELEKFDPNK